MHDESAYFTVSASSHEMYFWCCKKRGGEREREINISNATATERKKFVFAKTGVWKSDLKTTERGRYNDPAVSF